jgi:hypothetical protein
MLVCICKLESNPLEEWLIGGEIKDSPERQIGDIFDAFLLLDFLV